MSQKIQIKISFVALGLNFFFSKSKHNARVDRVVKFHCECLLFFVKGSRARSLNLNINYSSLAFVMCVNLLHL